MPEPEVAPYGAWRSPITAQLLAAGAERLDWVQLDGDDVYWTEGRPAEGGRVVLVRRAADGTVADVAPPPFNVRTRVHEYGGSAYVVHDGAIHFSNFDDNRLYRQAAGGQPAPISANGGMRYADGILDDGRGRLIWVREDHTVEGREPRNTLASMALDGSDERVIASGHDFYAFPRLSPDGSQLAWIAWDHPNMPWDGTVLYAADVGADGSLGDAIAVAGGPEESIFQPAWSPDGDLYFVSDRTGWWNIYRQRGEEQLPICPMEAEFGQPLWVLGMGTYAFASAQEIICAYAQHGRQYLARLDVASGRLQPIESPFTSYGPLQVHDGTLVCRAASPTEATCIARCDLADERWEVLRRRDQEEIDAGYVSLATAITFPTEHGLTAHGFFYAPKNKDYAGPAHERPPLLVQSHGGPTAATEATFSLATQYWTSRGIAVLDVNYGGSTGFGRAYRQRLDGQWGVVDVDDCVNGARFLAHQGLVDGERLAIEGGSAGGYTTLCALTFRDTFKAGASRFGVSDAEALAAETHKFESRYMDRMIGPYPARRDLYVERSPIQHTDRLNCPLILFQGLDDKVVPPNQAEMMYEAARKKGLPVAYLPFAGEGHGFRRAENIVRTFEAELYFFARIFGFAPADSIEPVEIANL